MAPSASARPRPRVIANRISGTLIFGSVTIVLSPAAQLRSADGAASASLLAASLAAP